MQFWVTFVCTGNVCRSPAAERLFRARMAPEAQVRVSSAGTHALTGHAMDGPSAHALAELAVDPAGHVARRLDLDDAGDVDLILCATTAHRRHILENAPRLMSKTFTLREFARLSRRLGTADRQGVPGPGDLREEVRAIAGQRGRAQAVPPAQDDIADPYGGGLGVARACIADIAVAVDATIAALGLQAR